MQELENLPHSPIKAERGGLTDSDTESNETQGVMFSQVADHSPKKRMVSQRMPTIIYQQYQPSNVTELREYMLFLISKDLQAIHNYEQGKNDNNDWQVSPTDSSIAPQNNSASNSRDQDQKSSSLKTKKAKKAQTAATEADSKKADSKLDSQTDTFPESKNSQDPPKKHFTPTPMTTDLGTGRMQNLSNKLIKYLNEFEDLQESLQRKFKGDVLLFDSLFESGNLLQADRVSRTEYRLYMQVDTNTKGHQQWFYFKVKNTRKDTKYTFQIMNFTKPGVTSGRGYGKNDLFQRIMYKSKLSRTEDWCSLAPDQLEFQKTKVVRRKKDALAAGADSDQDDWVEEAFGQDPNFQGQQANNDLAGEIGGFTRMMSNGDGVKMNSWVPNQRSNFNKEQINSVKKKKQFYYYALVFDVTFEFDNDAVFFAFSQPYPYSQITQELLDKEALLKPSESLINSKSANGQSYFKTGNFSYQQIYNNQLQKDLQQQEQKQQTENSIPSQMQSPLKTKDMGKNNQDHSHNLESPKNGPQQFSGFTFENKSQLIYYQRKELCRSICGFPIWQITISREAKHLRRKPTILITSRVHAGETPASIAFKGIYDFLVSDKREAKFLRRFYTFVLIPCLNPDGVICGNYRNAVSGVDLNRQWINPDPDFQPEIYFTKFMLKHFTEIERRQIWIYCDIHGHSKKKNSFFYGCNTAANGGFLSWTIVRILPRIFAQKTHLFNYKDCRFKVEPYKIGTGRVVAWKQFSITHSFTLENSFFGYDFGEDQSKEFTEEDYLIVGAKFCESVYELHFVWKQIRRELQITNGWLKPRVLIEKTGVPAAQLLNEELQKKKKAEEKFIAIQQYEAFLRKFYNSHPKSLPNKSSMKMGNGPGNFNFTSSQQGAIQNFNQTQLAIQNFQFSKEVAFPQSSQGQANFSFTNSNSVKKESGKAYAGSQVVVKEGDSATWESVNRSRNSKIKGITDSNSNSKGYLNNPEGNFGNRPPSSQNNLAAETQEQLYKKLESLIKIQALVRGVLTRIRLEKRFERERKSYLRLGSHNRVGRGVSGSMQKHTTSNSVLHSISQRSNERRSTSLRGKKGMGEHSESSLDNELLDQVRVANPQLESKDTLSGSQLERMSSRRVELMNRDWRHYFKNEELDKAFQCVEIEQREISEEASSAGSSSNPSEDNLDNEEIFGRVYGLNHRKQLQLIKQRKSDNIKFTAEVKDQSKISGAQMFAKLQEQNTDQNASGSGANAARNIQTGIPSRRGTLKFYRGVNQKTNSGVINFNSSIAGLQSNGQFAQTPDRQASKSLNDPHGHAYHYHNKNGTSPYYHHAAGQLQNPQFYPHYHHHYLPNHSQLVSQQALIQRTSSTHSPMHALDHHYINSDYNFSQTNIAFQQVNGRGLMTNHMYHRNSKQQQRAATSHAVGVSGILGHGLNITHHQHNLSTLHYSNPSQMRLLHLNYKHAVNKRENINQVIKDCFITKKCGVRKPTNQNQLPNQPANKQHNPSSHMVGGSSNSVIQANRDNQSSNYKSNQNQSHYVGQKNRLMGVGTIPSVGSHNKHLDNAAQQHSSTKKNRKIKRQKSPGLHENSYHHFPSQVTYLRQHNMQQYLSGD